MFRTRIAVAALCALVPLAAFGQATNDILPFKASEKTLPNGLKVIVVPTGFPNIVSLQIRTPVRCPRGFPPGLP